MRIAPIAPFSKPRRSGNQLSMADEMRGGLNQLQNALFPVTTPAVSGSAVIHDAPQGQAVAHVTGDDGTNAFADQVAWHPTGSAAVVSSATTKGAPAIRTYSVVGGALHVSMSAGSYAIQVIPTLFS